MGLGTPDFLLPMTADLNATIGTVTASYTGPQNVWFWDPDTSAYVQATGSPSYPFSSLGILLQPGRTNRLTSYNAPALGETSGLGVGANGTLSLVEDTSDTLTAAGLGAITNGYFHRCVASGGNPVVTLSGAVDTTNNCAFSMWYRLTGAARFNLQGATDYEIPASASWARFKVEDITPALATDQAKLELTDGATLDFVLQQLENDSATAYTGVGATDPIIVAGAETARNTFNLLVTLTSSILPTNNFVIAMDVTPKSSKQWGGAAYYFDILPSANDNLRVFGPASATREINTSEETVTAFNVFREETYTIAVMNQAEYGFEMFVNGYGSMVRGTNGAVAAGLQTYQMRVGRSASTTAYLNGWVRNLRVYQGAKSRWDVADETRTDLAEEIPLIGRVTYDPNTSGRIWALGVNLNARSASIPSWRYTKLQYSDDYGDTWTVVKTLASGGATPEDTLVSTLNISQAGDFFYSRGSGTGQDLCKIDGTTYAVTRGVIADWDNDGANGAGGSDLGKSWSYLPWLWGEDATNLYTAAYMTSASGAGDRYWYSSDGGDNWTLKNLSIVGARHLHALGVDPNTNYLWISVGDSSGRTTGWTDDNLGTALNTLTDTYPGPTGLTFTSEAVYFGTDEADAADDNFVQKCTDETNAVEAYAVPAPHDNAPIYYLRAQGDNALWLSGYAEESNEDLKYSYIMKLEKYADAGSQWRPARIVTIAARHVDGQNPYSIAHDGTGVIPAWADYVFVEIRSEHNQRQLPERLDIGKNGPSANLLPAVVRIPVTPGLPGKGDPFGRDKDKVRASSASREAASRIAASRTAASRVST